MVLLGATTLLQQNAGAPLLHSLEIGKTVLSISQTSHQHRISELAQNE
jgi:hypothetical protein